jgi:hypothetical protein
MCVFVGFLLLFFCEMNISFVMIYGDLHPFCSNETKLYTMS